MRSLAKLTKGLFTAGLVAATLSGLSGCGPDYALFKIHVRASSRSNLPRPNGSDNTAINQCEMTITDGNGVVVLDHYVLQKEPSLDSQGNQKLLAGCQGGLTPTDIGLFSWSTSNTKGTFTFRVDGWDDNRSVILQTATASQAAQVYPPELPELPLNMAEPQ
jgi:hypothetical protein